MTDRELAQFLALQTKIMQRSLPTLSQPEADETVHNFRVAIRRIRAVLPCCAGFLRAREHAAIERVLKSLAKATNPVRDAEIIYAWCVMRKGLQAKFRKETIAAFCSLLPNPQASRQHFMTRHKRKITATVARLKRLCDMAAAPQTAVSQPAVHQRSIKQLASKAKKLMAALRSERQVKKAHGLRIVVKELRYCLEASADDRYRRDIARLRSLQQRLGLLNDQAVIANCLRSLGPLRTELAELQRELLKQLRKEKKQTFADLKTRLRLKAPRSLKPIVSMSY